jgi:PPOX class probable F420-dependent enzyme
VPELNELAKSRFVTLTTFRGDGTPVATAVLVASDGNGGLIVRSTETTGKIRRIRKNPSVIVTPSNFRGEPRGAGARGRARILPDEDTGRGEQRLLKKYGLLVRIGLARSKRKHPDEKAVIINITDDAAEA